WHRMVLVDDKREYQNRERDLNDPTHKRVWTVVSGLMAMMVAGQTIWWCLNDISSDRRWLKKWKRGPIG
ncbi:unnamed protein product, partial [Citrullus colocynthis]